MATIVQDYGPIYGEVVNGTVQGRPNGSVYVPISNTISISIPELYRYVKEGTSIIRITTAAGIGQNATLVAVAQDLSSNIVMQLYSDAECTTLVARRNLAAGLFNTLNSDMIIQGSPTFTPGDICYCRAQLFNNGVAIATSDVIEVEVVA